MTRASEIPAEHLGGERLTARPFFAGGGAARPARLGRPGARLGHPYGRPGGTAAAGVQRTLEGPDRIPSRGDGRAGGVVVDRPGRGQAQDVGGQGVYELGDARAVGRSALIAAQLPEQHPVLARVGAQHARHGPRQLGVDRRRQGGTVGGAGGSLGADELRVVRLVPGRPPAQPHPLPFAEAQQIGDQGAVGRRAPGGAGACAIGAVPGRSQPWGGRAAQAGAPRMSITTWKPEPPERCWEAIAPSSAAIPPYAPQGPTVRAQPLRGPSRFG